VLPGFVELDRRFVPLIQSIDAEEQASNSYATYFDLSSQFDGSLTWKELLDLHVVVVLGEPGSGKSWESRNRASELNRQGNYAFYVRLDELAGNTLESCIEDKLRLRSWGRSNERAHFFLDSVDEAKFRTHSDFRIALEKFARTLRASEIARASFVLSSRISEWQPTLDEASLVSLYPPRKYQSNPTTAISQDVPTCVLLKPLNRAQTRLLVSKVPNFDVEEFIQSIDEAHAWEFARRPSDVMSLAMYWKKRGALGSLFDLLDFDVREKLKESGDRHNHDPLTSAQLREGAQSLAAANILCRKYSFHVPNGEAISADVALNSRDCLPENWKPGDRSSLLNRALFDGAAYGMIRIYHRRVTEYLCAEWINRCMENGCTIRELKGLLLSTANGTMVVRPFLAPIVAWLGCGERPWNAEVRAWLLRTKPTILLQYGDPGSLPADFQLNVLNAIVDRYGEYSETWIETDSEILARFSGRTVSERICQILLEPSYGEGVKRLMLRIVRFARLEHTIDSVIKLFSLPSSSVAIRMYCLAATRDVGTKQHKRDLFKAFDSLREVPVRLFGIACETLYPAEMSPTHLAAIIGKVPEVSIRAIGREIHLAEVFESNENRKHCVVLLAKLNILLATAPYISSRSTEVQISEKYCWCGVLLEPNLRNALRNTNLSDEESQNVAESIIYYEALVNFTDLHLHADAEFRALLSRNSSVRRSYVWLTSNRLRTKQSDFALRHRLSLSWGLFSLEPQDRQWLLEDLAQREDTYEKEVALSLLMELTDWLFGARDVKKAICQSLMNRDRLLEEYKRVRRIELQRCFLRLRNLWLVRTKRKVGQSIWQFGQHLKQGWEWYADFVLNVFPIVSGRHLDFLYETITQHRDNGDQWSGFNWTELLKRSPLLGRVVRKGCKNAWRRYIPQLRHDRKGSNTIELATIVGLPGIMASIRDGELNIVQVSEDESIRLTQYALNELNGVPEWFEGLAEFQPHVVIGIIEGCIDEEWKAEDYGTLHRMLYHCERLAPSLSEIVLQLLAKGDPGSHFQLIDALVLLSRCEVRQSLGEIAANRVRTNSLSDGKLITWLSVLMELNAQSAIDVVREAKDDLDPKEYDQLVANLCNALTREPRGPFPRFSNPSYLQPSILHDFIPVVFKSVRMPDDLVRDTGAYFPTARDGAQQFRNRILAKLASNESKEAHAVLVHLREHSALKTMRDYVSHLIEQQLERSSNLEPWEEKDIRDFERKFETVPRTARALFDITVKRLDDIKIAVEESDRSIRGNVRKGDDERCLRKFLARHLAEQSRGAYDPPEEVEIDLEERPDIRVVRPGLSPVSIEIKVAEKWSYNKLRSRLKEQLVDQYLKPNGSRYGIYVLGYINKEERGSWRHEHSSLGFQQLVAELRTRAIEIVRDDADVDGLEVIGINFHEPER
jgi:hypothetical protein